MAISMEKAFSKIVNREVTAEEVDRDLKLKKGLECNYCGIPVYHRTEHPRKEARVSALFYRKVEHDYSCKYNTVGQVSIIARQSSDKILQNINQKKFTFRLTMIYEQLNMVKAGEYSKKDNASIINRQKNRSYQDRGKLTPYLATMKKIIELRNILEKNTELHSIIKIEMYNKKIAWNNFYYESNYYTKAFDYLKKLEWKENHPICIEGIVRGVKSLDQEGRYAVGLRFGDTKTNNQDFTLISSPSIFCNEQDVSSEIFKEGQRIVVCALCTTREKNNYLNINISLYHKNQIVILENS
ncbi:hypothetical protein ACRBU7_14455 [Priestia aryabhattai]|uniref:hypothetical protein n=1 Tax=Priestia aryabhattai TaxID=412384 RepID=UPI003D7FA3D7